MSKIRVDYVDHMGDDLRVVNAARISYANTNEKLSERDEKLINYLAKHKHYTPFEHCNLTVVLHVPLYIRSQIHRHRTFSYNEVSRRYTSENLEFYEPEQYRKQHAKSKQCSDGLLSKAKNFKARLLTKAVHTFCLASYHTLIKLGVSREMARGLLPQNLMTKFYMSGNLRNWVAFLKLRLDGHAQEEAQYIAQEIDEILKEKFPIAGKALMEICEN